MPRYKEPFTLYIRTNAKGKEVFYYRTYDENLFGELAVDIALADKAVHTWLPDTPGKVTAVEFEWSPGRSQKGQYLENRSAFDVAFILDLGNGKKGVFSVETKYHEHAVTMTPTSDAKMEGYKTVGEQSGIARI